LGYYTAAPSALLPFHYILYVINKKEKRCYQKPKGGSLYKLKKDRLGVQQPRLSLAETQGSPQALRRGLVGLKSRVLLLRNPARETGTIWMLRRGRATARPEGGPRASGGSTQSTAPLDVSILLSPQVRPSASPHGARHPKLGQVHCEKGVERRTYPYFSYEKTWKIRGRTRSLFLSRILLHAALQPFTHST